jgi:hypothetical protein
MIKYFEFECGIGVAMGIESLTCELGSMYLRPKFHLQNLLTRIGVHMLNTQLYWMVMMMMKRKEKEKDSVLTGKEKDRTGVPFGSTTTRILGGSKPS